MRPDKKGQIVMAEYSALSSEVQQSMENRNRILAFGLATIGVVLYAGITILLSPVPQFAFPIFSILLPLLTLRGAPHLLVQILHCGKEGTLISRKIPRQSRQNEVLCKKIRE
jgi:hypothetical protein